MTIDRRRWAGRLALVLAGSVLLVGWSAGRSDAFLGPVLEKIEKVYRQTGTGIKNIGGGTTGVYSKNLLRGFPVESGKGVAKLAPKVVGRANPVGAILSAGQLAYWAYSEYDGGAAAPQPGGEAGDWVDVLVGGDPGDPYYEDSNMTIVEAPTVTGNSVSIQIMCTTPVLVSGSTYKCSGLAVGTSMGIGTNLAPGSSIQCQRPNLTTYTTTTLSVTAGSAFTGVNERTFTGSACLSGETILGFDLQPSTSTNPWLQRTPVQWGTLAPPTGPTYPPGELQFETAVIDATCKNSETGATQHIRTYSDWGASETIMLPSCKQRLGSQWYGVGIDIIPMDPTIGGDAVEDWPSHDSGDVLGEGWEPAPKTPAEDAMPCTTSATGCGLSVWVDGEVCTAATGACTDLETRHRLKPDTTLCKWGTETVPWKYCRAVVASFGGPTQTLTDPSAPRTPDDTTDPETIIPDGSDPNDPDSGDACLSWAGGWNPFVWVYKPVMCALKKAFVPKTWPDWGSTPSPLPAGWVPSFPSIAGGACGPVNMPGGLNLGPLLPSAPGGELFNSCDWDAARNVTYYGTLALMLVIVGTRAYRAVMAALGMAVEGTPV